MLGLSIGLKIPAAILTLLLLLQRGSADVVGMREQSLSRPLTAVENGKRSCMECMEELQ